MRVLLQRVTRAHVEVAGDAVGSIGAGLVALVGVGREDNEDTARRLAGRVAGYRMFNDHQGKMNLDIREVDGAALVVSQFTLAADTRKGRRPGFSGAAAPDRGACLYEIFVAALGEQGIPVATGRFGADMQVHLVNDGPVTFVLDM